MALTGKQRQLLLVTSVVALCCGMTGADEGVQSSSSLAVFHRHESSSVVFRPHSSRSHRQQILTRHGRKYENCCFPLKLRIIPIFRNSGPLYHFVFCSSMIIIVEYVVHVCGSGREAADVP